MQVHRASPQPVRFWGRMQVGVRRNGRDLSGPPRWCSADERPLYQRRHCAPHERPPAERHNHGGTAAFLPHNGVAHLADQTFTTFTNRVATVLREADHGGLGGLFSGDTVAVPGREGAANDQRVEGRFSCWGVGSAFGFAQDLAIQVSWVTGFRKCTRDKRI